MSTTSQQPEQPADPTANFVVAGRYRLLQRIGSGGMGVVWAGRDEVLRRPVAVKELHHTSGSSERTVAEGRERSLREARAAAALHHRNIVAVYDIVDHGGRPWIVMELVSGRSLKEQVAEDGPLPLERVVHIGLGLLSALQAAHAAGITHRDVKPANVLVAADDVVRLTDFGLATMQDAETLTESGVVLGTPGYLAPEQARGLSPGPPADVFGLGATLYYAIEGVGPFQREGYLPMLVAYARHEIRRPQRAGALAPVLLRLLTADPAKRPTAEQARQMLLDGAVRRSGLSRRRLLIAGGAATAVVAATGGAGLWFDERYAPVGRSARARVPLPPPTPTPTPTPSTTAPPVPTIGVGTRAWHHNDLRQPVPVGPVVIGAHRNGVLAVDAETGEARWRRGSPSDWSIVQIAKSRAFVSGPAGALVLDAATGAVRARHAPMANMSRGVAGMFLSVLDEPASTLVAYDADTGRQQWRVSADGYFSSEFFSTAGGLLCADLSRGDRQSWLYGIDRRTGAVAWRTRMTTKGIVKGHWGHGTQIYATTIQGGEWTLVAVDARTGARRWAVLVAEYDEQVLEPPISLAGVAVINGLVVATVRDTRFTLELAGLIAVDAGTGVVRWRRRLLNPSVAAVTGKRLFVSSYDSVLHELDPATGLTVWDTSTEGPVDRLAIGPTMLIAAIGHGATAYPLVRR